MDFGGENLHLLDAREIVVEVEHVEAHRTKKEKKEVSLCEKFVIEGNEKADELSKAGAILDEGFMAGSKSRNFEERERGGVCSLAVRSQLSLLCGRMERL